MDGANIFKLSHSRLTTHDFKTIVNNRNPNYAMIQIAITTKNNRRKRLFSGSKGCA